MKCLSRFIRLFSFFLLSIQEKLVTVAVTVDGVMFD